MRNDDVMRMVVSKFEPEACHGSGVADAWFASSFGDVYAIHCPPGCPRRSENRQAILAKRATDREQSKPYEARLTRLERRLARLERASPIDLEELGLAEWFALGADDAVLCPPEAGTAVHWVDGVGFVEGEE